MRDIIRAAIGADHYLKCPTYTIARNGEGLTPCLSITIPDGLAGYWAYIDFKKANGETFKTPRIDVNEGVITYDIHGSVLDVEGKLEVQVVFQNADGEIWKTYVKEFAVRYSINAVDDITDKKDWVAQMESDLKKAQADVANKVDKLTPTDRLAINEMVEGSKGLYCADWGGTKLVKLDYDKTPYTVPYRMENGHIIVGMIGINRKTEQEEVFRGCALPHTYLNQELEYLSRSINSAQTEATVALGIARTANNNANTAQKTADSKKISTWHTYAKTTLDWNSVYVIWSGSGNADIELYNSATGAKVTDTAGEELPAVKVCLLLLPKENSINITGSGEEQPQKTKRCLFFGTTGSVLNPTTSKQFVIGDGDLYYTPTSSGASIYKIGL